MVAAEKDPVFWLVVLICSGDNATEGFIPETMINLEVWVPIGSNLKDPDIASGGLDECGILGPGGR